MVFRATKANTLLKHLSAVQKLMRSIGASIKNVELDMPSFWVSRAFLVISLT